MKTAAFRAGKFTVTTHAAIRYRDRVRPALSVIDARRELQHIVPLGIVGPRPDFASGDHVDNEFLFVGDDIAFPVVNGCLLTCMVAGTISPKARERRQEKRKRRRERRVVRNRHGFHPERTELAA